MLDPLDEIDELQGQVERLEHTLARERDVAAEWKNRARKAESRSKAQETQIDTLTKTAREHRNKAHTWRLLYQDLLNKIGRKLDLEGEIR